MQLEGNQVGIPSRQEDRKKLLGKNGGPAITGVNVVRNPNRSGRSSRQNLEMMSGSFADNVKLQHIK